MRQPCSSALVCLSQKRAPLELCTAIVLINSDLRKTRSAYVKQALRATTRRVFTVALQSLLDCKERNKRKASIKPSVIPLNGPSLWRHPCLESRGLYTNAKTLEAVSLLSTRAQVLERAARRPWSAASSTCVRPLVSDGDLRA